MTAQAPTRLPATDRFHASRAPFRAPRPIRSAVGAAFAALLLGLGAGQARAQEPRLPTVAAVDLQRYAGTWHEIARLPNRFQAHCVGDTTATYTPDPDGTVAVLNRCRTRDGSFEVADATAWPQDPGNAKLKVSFLPRAIRWLPIGRGDYWVLELGPQYDWVLVGEPGLRYLWVLARQPSMPKDTLEGLLARARQMGFPVDRIEFTPQAAGAR
jgi:apolipoprotein D and lipocalin family protein